MIYALIVLYNSKVKFSQILEMKKEGLTPVIFDNTVDRKIKSFNFEFCLTNNIKYETKNINVGISKAYNFIIKKYVKENDWIVILDQDTDVPSLYYKLISNLVVESKYRCFFSIFKYGNSKYGPKIIKDVRRYKMIKMKSRSRIDGYLLGINSCSLIKGDVFKKIGFYDEELFLDYVDVDFAMRLALHGIKSETIDVNLKQHFFSKEKTTFTKAKNRYSIQKHDAKKFYNSKYLKGFLRRKYCYYKDIFKFAFLYSKTNNIFWFFPLLFTKEKAIEITLS